MELETSLLQKELLKMMKLFHQVCDENKLHYYMLGGTCLGAIRHKGFIPWDDDMDIGMPREDYNIFCNKWKEILPQPLELRYYKTEPNSPFHYAKLINARTTLIERNYKNYIEGIYIDIFPLDSMDSYGIFEHLRAKLIWLNGAALIYHCTTTRKKSFKKLIKFFIKRIPLKLLHNVEEFLMTMNKSKNPKLLCNFLGAWKDRELIKSEIFGTPTLYSFEDSLFYGPADVHGYLTCLYDNYMQLPPIKYRICKHDYFYVNIKLPYKEYLKKE